MNSLLYGELTPWYRLLDSTEDHLEEAAVFEVALRRAIKGESRSLLELGAGAGNNGFHLKGQFECTLTDPSSPMLDLSRDLNPECEHLVGDMRSLRLEREFDAVLVHDAIVYMHTVEEVREALETAFVHLRPGGAAIIAPDCTRESFQDATTLHQAASGDGSRSLRCLDWTRDPNPADDTYTVDYAFLLEDGNGVRAVHDRHIEGLFAESVWIELLKATGFEVQRRPRVVEEDDPYADFFFVARRPT
ncbi:MAG: trans-aconitate 2-methyltransferase [Polyangiales bacterium]